MKDETKHLSAYQYNTTVDGKPGQMWAQRANVNHFRYVQEMREKGFIYHEETDANGRTTYWFTRDRYRNVGSAPVKQMSITINGKTITSGGTPPEVSDQDTPDRVVPPLPEKPAVIIDDDDLPF